MKIKNVKTFNHAAEIDRVIDEIAEWLDRMQNEELEAKYILESQNPNTAIDVVHNIETALLQSDLEWGITYDPKAKAWTICIAEVEV